jgi:restriction endonuclease Mrr
VTRASADQGIDFFGRVPIGEILKPAIIDSGVERHFKVWLVGQAKHYRSTQVSTKDIRELVGSVALAKSKVFAGKIDPLASLQMRICDPVVYMFFTTGSITRDARDILNRAGVVAMDGLQLAMFLADHSVGLDGIEFAPATFRAWLNP